MHESTSRWLCQFSFVCLGLLPLFVCCLWAIFQYLPIYHRWQIQSWEQRLSTASGFKVQIGQVRHPRPRQVLFSDLRLVDPESNISVARAGEVSLTLGASCWLILLDDTELEGRPLREQWGHFHENVLCRPRPAAMQVVLNAKRVVVHDGSPNPVVLQDFQGELTSRPSSSQELREVYEPAQTTFNVGFRPESPAGQSELCEVRITRIHEAGLQKTDVQLLARSFLPNQLVQQIWAPSSRLGADARIRGQLNLTFKTDTWLATTGSAAQEATALQVEQVDFGDLTWNAPSEMTGTGTLALQGASLSSSGLHFLRGQVVCQDGRVSRSLLLDAERRLGLRLARSIFDSPTDEIPFRLCGFAFDVSASSLSMKGMLSDQGIMMVDGQSSLRSLVGEPVQTVGQVHDLVPLLDSRHMQQVHRTGLPQSELARSVMRLLPKESAQVASGGLQAATSGVQR